MSSSLYHSNKRKKLLLDSGIKIKEEKPYEKKPYKKIDLLLDTWIINTITNVEAFNKEYSFLEITKILDISDNALVSNNRKKRILDSGIKIKSNKTEEEIDQILENWINDTLKDKLAKHKSYSFTNITKLLNLTGSSITSNDIRKQKILNSGIKINKITTPEEIDNKLDNWLNNIKKILQVQKKNILINILQNF